MLQITNLSFSFSATEVLKDLTLTANEDKITCIIGPSGSGKSTLFELIGGLLPPNSGEISYRNESLLNKKGSIAFMPQEATLLPWRTIEQNVALPLELRKEKIDKEAIQTYLRKAGLGEYAEAFPKELSGGMRQRVSFVRALVSNVPLMLLDEPFSALDELTRREMQKWLLALLTESPRTILFVTHQIEEALYLADNIVVLSNRPAKVVKEINITRTNESRDEWIFTQEAQQLKKEILHVL